MLTRVAPGSSETTAYPRALGVQGAITEPLALSPRTCATAYTVMISRAASVAVPVIVEVGARAVAVAVVVAVGALVDVVVLVVLMVVEVAVVVTVDVFVVVEVGLRVEVGRRRVDGTGLVKMLELK